jgi:hypothetical protein
LKEAVKRASATNEALKRLVGEEFQFLAACTIEAPPLGKLKRLAAVMDMDVVVVDLLLRFTRSGISKEEDGFLWMERRL